MKRALLAILATIILAAPKPLPSDPTFEMDAASDPSFGGTVSFDVTGLSNKQADSAMIDVQCYGSVSGGTNNVGWWDTKPYDTTFTMGSSPSVAPPDMGSIIKLAWSVFPGLPMDCTARLWNASKKGLAIHDTLTFTTT